MPDYNKAAKLAEKVVEENFVTTAPVRIDEIIRNYGFKIVPFNFAEMQNLNGFIDLPKKTIFIDDSDQEPVKAFTLARALGYTFLFTPDASAQDQLALMLRHPLGQSSDYPNYDLNQETNWFAANLLVPEKLLKNYKNEDSNSLSKIFGVTAEVVGYRMQSHG